MVLKRLSAIRVKVKSLKEVISKVRLVNLQSKSIILQGKSIILQGTLVGHLKLVMLKNLQILT